MAELERRQLDGLLMFRQESMYYLTGYDTFGYVFFQCLYLRVDGQLTLLTRAPDYLQARFTSVVEEVCIWVDGPNADPAWELREMLRARGFLGKRFGIEWEACGLTRRNALRLNAVPTSDCTLIEASDLIIRMRVVKSDEQLKYLRQAGKLADEALGAGLELARTGAYEGDILAAMQGAITRRGGDDPANEFIIGSGPGALMCRYYTGRCHLDANDQLTLEFAGVYRHYHGCLMRTIPVGTVDQRLNDM